jgi:hypothetical protein
VYVKKIIMILILCVSCGKPDMKPEDTKMSSAVVVQTTKSLCEKKCSDTYTLMVENINKVPTTTYDYKQELINNEETTKKDCLSHCDTCDSAKWDTSIFTETTGTNWNCTTPSKYASPVCGFENPSTKAYCKESDWK